MLETPSIRWYSSINVSPGIYGEPMGSENPSGADNQQERLFTKDRLAMRDGERENVAGSSKSSEALRILRDHTPTLFPVSGEEDDMARSPRRRGEVDRNVSPPLRR
jgi:hypothetical protein